jgi:hypothetical protein
LDRGYADFREHPGLLKNSPTTRSRLRSDTKDTDFGLLEPDLWP